MKRDVDKVRSVMLALEGYDGPFLMTMDTPALGDTKDGQEAVEYILMLNSPGFLESSQHSVYRISWAGHEFLDSVRYPEIWRKTKRGCWQIGILEHETFRRIGDRFCPSQGAKFRVARSLDRPH